MDIKIHAEIANHQLLSKDQANVLKYACEGYTRKQIAEKTGLCYSQVKRKYEELFETFFVHNAPSLVAVAVAKQIVNISLKSILVVISFNACLLDDDARRPPRPPRIKIARTRTDYA